MKIAIRKEPNGSIYIDREIFNRTKIIINENKEEIITPLFAEEELSKPPYNYKKIEIADKYLDFIPNDFNDDLTFNVEKYNERKQENSKEELRAKRVPLLKAFDVYKSNVNYGVEFEDETDRINIITWYRLLLELNEKAFESVPERVKYYL